MCQIVALTCHSSAERNEIISKVWNAMAPTQKDGFGAAWYSKDGRIGYFKSKLPVIPGNDIPGFVRNFGEGLDIPSDGGFLIIHGRTATCGKEINNAHPMLAYEKVGEDKVISAAMVHNGVVDSETYKNVNNTCDSELLLQAYVDGGIKGVEEHITGYYAFMYLELLDKEVVDGVVTGRKSLHIARDNRAPLHCGRLQNGGYSFATNENLLTVVGSKDKLGEVNDNTHIVFTSLNEWTDSGFTPKPKKAFSWEAENRANAAFGHNSYPYNNSHGSGNTGGYSSYSKQVSQSPDDLDKELEQLEELARKSGVGTINS